MAGKSRRFGLGVVMSVALVLAVASTAWACGGRPRIYGLSSQSGPEGTTVVMSGGDLRPNAPVEIRWNGLEGEKIAETTANSAGQFSVTVTVPAVAADVYSLVAASEGRVTQAAFEVTGAEAPTAAAKSGTASNSSPLNGMTGAYGGLLLLAAGGLGLLAMSRRNTGAPLAA